MNGSFDSFNERCCTAAYILNSMVIWYIKLTIIIYIYMSTVVSRFPMHADCTLLTAITPVTTLVKTVVSCAKVIKIPHDCTVPILSSHSHCNVQLVLDACIALQRRTDFS